MSDPKRTPTDVITDALELIRAPTAADDWHGLTPGDAVVRALAQAGWVIVRADSAADTAPAPEGHT